VEDEPRVEEQLQRIDGLRGTTDRVVLLGEVRKLLAEAEAALAQRHPELDEPKDPSDSSHDAA
jgi:hypothetical protein